MAIKKKPGTQNLYYDSATGIEYEKDEISGDLNPISIGGSGLVQEEPLSGPVQKILITNPTSTRGVWHLAGARGIEVVLSELAASNITKFFYTLNAVDDGDADSRLLSVSVRELIYKSEKDKRLLIAAPAGNRIKRFDYKSDQATPTGTLEIYLRAGG